MNPPDKKLGQHWLKDETALEAICQAANLTPGDTILEIGPGQGDLTRQLIQRAGRVVAVEKDTRLTKYLTSQVSSQKLTVVDQDILRFDLSQLPQNYKVVASIPYYLTSNLLRTLSESANPPTAMVLLVQKEVAERVCAEPGQMSLLAVSVQLYYRPELGLVVPAKLFTPPPRVDSRVLILKGRPKPLFTDLDPKLFFQIVKAGFAGRRKKLRGSLAAGLAISKQQADGLLKGAGIDPGRRAQELSLSDWYKLYKIQKNITIKIL